MAMDMLFPLLAGSSLQGSRRRVPEQVPSVLLLAPRSLDGAMALNIHVLDTPNMRKDGLSPGPELPALPQAKQPLFYLYTLPWPNLSRGSRPFSRQ